MPTWRALGAFVFLLFVFLLNGCGFLKGEMAKVQSESSSPAPSAATLIPALLSPIGSPANDPTPSIRVLGTRAGGIVRLYTDSECQSELASTVAAGDSVDITLPNALTEGTHTIFAGIKVSASPETVCSASGVTYLLDTTPPTADSVLIDGNATYTKSVLTELTFSSSGSPAEMYITSSAGCASGGAWEPYSETGYAWLLSQNNSNVSVFVKLRDAAGNESACISDSIVHDDNPPSAPTGFDDEEISVAITDSSYATWTASIEAGSGLARYELKIGTSLGGDDILPWTNIGTPTADARSGLSLAQGPTYYTTIRAVDNAGNISSEMQGDGWVVVPSVTVSPRYAIAPNWNDYANKTTPTNACAGTELGYFLCLHGGEKKSVSFPAAASCAGYSISDLLGAFEWVCDDSGGAGNVFFHSKRLKHDKALADLVTQSAWRDNRIVIKQGTTPVAGSARGAWWTNAVGPLPPSDVIGTDVVLSETGKVYTVTSSMTALAPYRMDTGTGDKIAIAIMPGAILSLSSSASGDCNGTGFKCLFSAVSTKFNWFEGRIDGPGSGSSNRGLAQSGNFHVVRRMSASEFRYGFGYAGSNLSRSYYFQVVATNNLDGLIVKGSNNTFNEITTIGNSSNGIIMGDLANNNVFQNIVSAHNGSAGLYHYTNQNTVITGFTSISNSNYGLYTSSDTGGMYHNLLLLNSGTDIQVGSGSNTTYSQLAVDDIFIAFLNSGKFAANWVTNSAPTCTVNAGTNPGLVNSTCASQGASNFVRSTGQGSFALMGHVTTDDSINQSDSNGLASFAAILDWFGFENRFRGWGKNEVLSSISRGHCTSGSCRIWDFRLDSLDTRFRNTTFDGVNQNAAFVSGGACPAYLGGNVVTVSVNATPRTYMNNAIEILGENGDNDGLCESGETCLYTPNFGAYQGEGDYTQKWCTVGAGGTITNVLIYAY